MVNFPSTIHPHLMVAVLKAAALLLSQRGCDRIPTNVILNRIHVQHNF